MTTSRLIVLQLVLVAGLGTIFFLPKVAKSSPQGISLELPAYVGGWYGEDQAVSDLERKVLAKDTEFARKLYTDGRGGQIYASIVLSGQDLDNSIHRPERCLPAQGWSIADSRVVDFEVAAPGNTGLEATRLHNVRKVVTNNGETVPIYNVTYYWFVGYNVSTPSHLERTYMDIRDRIVFGYNQRWAYITVAATITKGLEKFGKDEAETDAMLREFIRQLAPTLIGPRAEPPTLAATP